MKNLAQSGKTLKGGLSPSNGDSWLSLPHEDATALSSLRDEPTESRLDSWKEIASYLGRQVRTVQRWEKREHLPVHRHYHEKTGSIYAFKGEIETWRKGRSLRPSDSGCQRSMSTLPSGKFSSLVFPGQFVQRNSGPQLLSLHDLSESWANLDFVTAVLYFAPEAISLPAHLHLARPQIPSPVRASARNGRAMHSHAGRRANAKS